MEDSGSLLFDSVSILTHVKAGRITHHPSQCLALVRTLWRGMYDIPVSWITLPATPFVAPTIMSLEAARNLSIPDLIHVLNEKLNLEWSSLLQTPLPPSVSLASVDSDVRVPSSVHLNEHGALQSTSSSKVSNPEHTIS